MKKDELFVSENFESEYFTELIKDEMTLSDWTVESLANDTACTKKLLEEVAIFQKNVSPNILPLLESVFEVSPIYLVALQECLQKKLKELNEKKI